MINDVKGKFQGRSGRIKLDQTSRVRVFSVVFLKLTIKDRLVDEWKNAPVSHQDGKGSMKSSANKDSTIDQEKNPINTMSVGVYKILSGYLKPSKKFFNADFFLYCSSANIWIIFSLVDL